jgi:hypothetical protein
MNFTSASRFESFSSEVIGSQLFVHQPFCHSPSPDFLSFVFHSKIMKKVSGTVSWRGVSVPNKIPIKKDVFTIKSERE